MRERPLEITNAPYKCREGNCIMCREAKLRRIPLSAERGRRKPGKCRSKKPGKCRSKKLGKRRGKDARSKSRSDEESKVVVWEVRIQGGCVGSKNPRWVMWADGTQSGGRSFYDEDHCVHAIFGVK